jgi:ribosomal protein S18 acetylase RimI-like enzyme
MNIRRLLPADAPAYRALMLDAYARDPEAFTASVEERAPLPLPWWEGRLRDDAQADQVVVGAFIDAQLAGVAGIGFETRPKLRHKCNLFGMAVLPAFRRRGLGQALVNAAIEFAASRSGIRLIQLTVTDGNAAARTLYQQCGFVPFGVEPLAVALGSGYVSKLHMWRDLRAPLASRASGEGSTGLQ